MVESVEAPVLSGEVVSFPSARGGRGHHLCRADYDLFRPLGVYSRVADLVAGLLGTALVVPVIAGVGIALRMQGHEVFVHERFVGKAGAEIVLRRLNTRFAAGRTPYLLHVVSGELSLVGPSPADWAEVEGVYRPLNAAAAYLETVPGLFGPGRLHPADGSSGMGRMLADSVYARRRTFVGDALLLGRVVLRLLHLGRGHSTPSKSGLSELALRRTARAD